MDDLAQYFAKHFGEKVRGQQADDKKYMPCIHLVVGRQESDSKGRWIDVAIRRLHQYKNSNLI